ncbi:GDP-mannose 4,6-dehydratase [Bradyrhizobium sp. SRL28]|uniref:GDP-mannose 4,6-dehydratase n=1 Tax=Bradyrhizobium sp. SRL28 TaxID=2836178 RepID=UPI001BDE6D28|nr:GDP-mannose 4,6-dehydratase [Bradyrhizobium sp. SRL28]MBT1516415.1 GDP-mannose 4,6-dehydratase [Bradyrhizobium sp. SRL28]
MSSFQASMRIFLIGYADFKGSRLALWLQRLDVTVTGYALTPPSATPSLFEIARLAGMGPILGDVTNCNHLVGTLRSAAPDIVTHIAAQPLLPYSHANPSETYRANVMGTAHLLQAGRQMDSVRAVLTVTSDKCYENREWIRCDRENGRICRLSETKAGLGTIEPVFSADGSSGLTWTEFAGMESCVSAIRLSKNVGAQRSVLVDDKHARGDAVMQIEADLQDPSELRAELFDLWRSAAGVSTAIRRVHRPT